MCLIDVVNAVERGGKIPTLNSPVSFLNLLRINCKMQYVIVHYISIVKRTAGLKTLLLLFKRTLAPVELFSCAHERIANSIDHQKLACEFNAILQPTKVCMNI